MLRPQHIFPAMRIAITSQRRWFKDLRLVSSDLIVFYLTCHFSSEEVVMDDLVCKVSRFQIF
jgi:hypothetical protein